MKCGLLTIASNSSSCWILSLLVSWCPKAFFELHRALLSLWHFPYPLRELFFLSHPISCAVQFVVGLPFAEPSPLCADVQLAACCVQVEMESSPGVACSLTGAVKATEGGEREFDRLKQCWGKSLPKDCFSSRFTEQSRRRMRGRRDSENTQAAASVSLMKDMKEWSKGSCSLWQPVCLGSLGAAGLGCFFLCT